MQHNNVIPMMIIMVFSGLLSSMSIWSDKLSDVQIGFNDIYMILLMIGWMLLFMGFYEKSYNYVIYSLFIIIFSFTAIRTQLFITPENFLKNMIPHHSMAVMMSKKLLENNSSILDTETIKFTKDIIDVQNKEINWMKNKLITYHNQ